MAKILVVDDDPAVLALIQDCLESERHDAEAVVSGKEAVDRLRLYHYDLVILDWQLPDLEGIQVLEQHRRNGGQTPILMLTAMDHIRNKETGFAKGADDYLTKPFFVTELLARVKALLRRPHAMTPSKLVCRNIEMDPTAHEVTKDGVKVELLPKEFKLLELFLRNPNQVFSLEAILDRVWVSESDTTPESVRTCIQRLRKKIDTPGEQSIVGTIYGIGYKLEP